MKIISLSPAITEILFSLQAGSQIAGNTYLCDYPDKAKTLPKVGSFTSVDFEKINNLKPDLIITSTIVQKRIYTELKKRYANTLYIDPRSIQDILQSIKLIGKSVNRQEEALNLVRKMEKSISKLLFTKRTKQPRIYIEEWYDPPMYSGNWVPEIVELAGGRYFSSDHGGISKGTDEKQLIKFDPEFIFVSYCGFGKKSDTGKILHRKNWQNISAVRNQKVFAVNETVLNRPGPRILLSAYEIRSYLPA